VNTSPGLDPQPSRQYSTKSFFIQPVLAPLAGNRWLSLILLAVFCLQAGLATAGLTGWQCPVRAVFGIPCPGCGLSTALGLLLRGKWRESFTTHAFAPVFLLGAFLLLIVALLPGRLRQEAGTRIERIEVRSGIVAILLVGLIVYWLARLWYGF
jgi:hypothetical protein